MSKLPIDIAEKLLLLKKGTSIQSSKLKHEIVLNLISEGILYKPGKHKSNIELIKPDQLALYLENNYAIKDLELYIKAVKNKNISRRELVIASTDSKLTKVRTFKGFLVNSYSPIQVFFNEKTITIKPLIGTFQFIYDFEKFIPSPKITIIGIENPENFRYIEYQKYLFKGIQPLFVSRYPQNQSKDLIKWLKSIPNNYLHFGDFDMAGIGIYLSEFKKHLSDKATFFVPDNIETLIIENGNKKRYDKQIIHIDPMTIKEINVTKLIHLLHKYKKGLDQEILIKN